MSFYLSVNYFKFVWLRKILSILLLFLVLVGFSFKSFVVLYYYANKSVYVSQFCQNKFKPETKCEGKCHLGSQLSLQNNTNENENSIPAKGIHFEELFKLYVFANFETSKIELKQIAEECKDTEYALLEGYEKTLLRPPIV